MRAVSHRLPTFPSRFLVPWLLLIGAGAVRVAPAAAHPMGNFSINHYTRLEARADRIAIMKDGVFHKGGDW